MNIKLKEEIRFSMRLRGAGGRGKLTREGGRVWLDDNDVIHVDAPGRNSPVVVAAVKEWLDYMKDRES